MSIRFSNIFLLRRLHSLSGLVPIGAFLIEHFYTNFKAIDGANAFNTAVKDLRVLLPGPLLEIAEVLFIFLPIIFHAGLGAYIAYTMRNNAPSYSYVRNWLYFFQRVAGIFLIIFIAAHTASMRFGFWGLIPNRESVYANPDNAFSIVQADLSDPLILAFYFLGVLSAAYHFSYGLWSFGIHWGITVSERSQKASQLLCTGIGVAVLMVGLAAALAFV
jgi:succinate dehydrogenase / fumarate reductase, cytochrome b subunit